MRIPARPGRLAHRGPPGGWIARVLAAVVFAATAVMPAACGNSGPPTGPGSVTPDTSTLAGTWKGTIDGIYGHSVYTMLLKADSTYSGEGEKPEYCKVSGSWTVSSNQFTAKGATGCSGVVVTFVAPVASLRLTGTWSGNAASSGTFTVAKQ